MKIKRKRNFGFTGKIYCIETSKLHKIKLCRIRVSRQCVYDNFDLWLNWLFSVNSVCISFVYSVVSVFLIVLLRPCSAKALRKGESLAKDEAINHRGHRDTAHKVHSATTDLSYTPHQLTVTRMNILLRCPEKERRLQQYSLHQTQIPFLAHLSACGELHIHIIGKHRGILRIFRISAIP